MLARAQGTNQAEDSKIVRRWHYQAYSTPDLVANIVPVRKEWTNLLMHRLPPPEQSMLER